MAQLLNDRIEMSRQGNQFHPHTFLQGILDRQVPTMTTINLVSLAFLLVGFALPKVGVCPTLAVSSVAEELVMMIANYGGVCFFLTKNGLEYVVREWFDCL